MYCVKCGQSTSRRTPDGDSRERDVCDGCGFIHYENPRSVVGTVPLLGERIILCRRAIAPRRGYWTLPAGFLETGETTEEGAARETREEAGIGCGRVKYFASQPWPFPSSLMIGCFAEALTRDIVVDRAELEDARWFDKAEVADMLARRHGDGLTTPPPVAIAHHIIRAWMEDETGFD